MGDTPTRANIVEVGDYVRLHPLEVWNVHPELNAISVRCYGYLSGGVKIFVIPMSQVAAIARKGVERADPALQVAAKDVGATYVPERFEGEQR